MNELVVVVPVLARPRNVEPLVASYDSARTVSSRLLFVCSPDDARQIQACEKAAVGFIVAEFAAGSGDFARKINLAYSLTVEPFIFQAADDVDFQPGWDAEALSVAETLGVGVVGTNDDGNPAVMRGDHSTHSLIRRAYVDEHGGSLDGPGVVFHPGYGHQFCDTELVELAKSRGEWGFAADAVVRHHHPFWDRRVRTDATYRKGLSTGAADRRLYQQRSRRWTTVRAG